MPSVTIEELKAYMVIPDDQSDVVLGLCLEAAKAFALRYTGLTFEESEDWPADLKLAVIKLTAQHFEHREGVLVDQSAEMLPNDVEATLDSLMLKSF